MANARGTVTSYVNGNFVLNFDKKDQSLNHEVEQRMISTFFTVYPPMVARFNPNAPHTVQFIVDPEFDKCPAETSGSKVTLSAKWLHDNPADTDVVTHEVMHIVQSYPHYNHSWLVEGIADYVRAKYGINNESAGWSMPNYNSNQNYTDSYRVTARFLMWLENRVNSTIIETLDSSMRQSTYNDNLWQQITGKTINQLWSEYAHDPNLGHAQSNTNVTSGGIYKIINIHSGKALDVAQSGQVNGTNVQIYTDNGTNAQKWRINSIGNGLYKLINAICNKALDVDHSGTSNGTNVHIWDDNGTNAQRWRLERSDGNNIYKIINVISGKALDVTHSGTADCTNVQIWSDNGTSAQKWQLIQLL